MAFGDEFTSMFNPNGGYGNQVDLFGSGGGIDFSSPTVDYTPDSSGYDFNFGGGSGSGDYSSYGSLLGNQFQVQPDLSQYWAQGTPSMSDEAYAGSMIPQYNLGDSSGQGGDSSFLGGMWDKFSALPLDKQFGLGAGLVSGLGSMMGSIQNNKLAKKAMKQNAKVQAYQNAAMARANQNAEIADRYNNSYDTTTPATVNYTPLTREQAMNYGETGAPHQQLEVTPGVTTRNYLANGGMPSSGQADNIHAMLSEGEFVIPADVVSALGDGNTNAGASALHQMMQNVRKTARSGTIAKIPPKAKTPMSYMKKGGK